MCELLCYHRQVLKKSFSIFFFVTLVLKFLQVVLFLYMGYLIRP